jgi:hypothetical protein
MGKKGSSVEEQTKGKTTKQIRTEKSERFAKLIRRQQRRQ